MTNLWSFIPLWKSVNLLNTANMLLLRYRTISFQVNPQSKSSNVCTPVSHYWPLSPHSKQGTLPAYTSKGSSTVLALVFSCWSGSPQKPSSSLPSLDTDSNASFRPCLFCNHDFPHDTWIFLTSVSHLCFCTTTTSSTSSHLLNDTTLKKLTHWFECVPILLSPHLYRAYLWVLLFWVITDVQYQQVYIPLWYFKRANTLRDFSMYWSSTLISLILLLPFLQRAAQCFGKRSILNTQRQWFWFTCSFWKQYPLNKTAAAALAGF